MKHLLAPAEAIASSQMAARDGIGRDEAVAHPGHVVSARQRARAYQMLSR